MKLNFDKNLIEENSVVAIALSGGSDSSALLYALSDYSKTFNFTLKAINIEHGIRGAESKRDTDFCISQCNTLNIEIRTFSVDAISYAKQNNLGIEQAARMLRYQCFMSCLNNGFCDKIATAHHKSDFAETVLFNLIRGTGLGGAKGFFKVSYNGKIIRPLLSVSKEEIMQYVDYLKIPYVNDSSNLDTDYSRNYIRHEIVPLIKNRFPAFESSLQRFAENAGEDDNYLYSLAQKEVCFLTGKATMPCTLEKPLFARAAILCMKHIGIVKDYTSAHIDELMNLSKLSTGNKTTLINGAAAVKEYDKIVFYPLQETTSPIYNFAVGTFEFDKCTVNVELVNLNDLLSNGKLCYKADNGSYLQKTLYINAEAVSKKAVIRLPTIGDYFQKFGGGTKSLKKHLVDEKIPSATRQNLPIVCEGKNVLAIVGCEISPQLKISASTSKVLKITCTYRG